MVAHTAASACTHGTGSHTLRCSGHILQVYKNASLLAESVAEFIHLGIARDEGIVVLVTPEHWEAIHRALAISPERWEALVVSGQVQRMFVTDVLRRIMIGDQLIYSNFIDLLASVSGRFTKLRFYGEVVDVLTANRQLAKALELEDFWNRYLAEHPKSSLLCGYSAAHFAQDSVAEALEQVRHQHTAQIDVESVSKLSEEELYRRIAALEFRNLAVQAEESDVRLASSEIAATKEQLAQAGKLTILGELCAGLAHELNNPLTIIRGNVRMANKMAERSAGDPKQALCAVTNSLETIDTASVRMSKIVSSVMLFARQTPVLNHAVFSIEKSLHQAIDSLQDQLRNSRVIVTSELAFEDGLTSGDEELMTQALGQIMSNASDALADPHRTEPGRIEIHLSAPSFLEIALTITDNGTGMEQEALAKVFYPFFTTKGVGRGTGLGLSIAHGIISEHKGSISCQSQPGTGTAFHIRLPRAKAPIGR